MDHASAMHRFRLISFLILLSIFSWKVSGDPNGQKYVCRTKQDREELDSSKVERLLIDKDVVYLFLPTKVLYFKLPYISITHKAITVNQTISVPKNGTEPSDQTQFTDDNQSLNETKPVVLNKTEMVNITRALFFTKLDKTYVISRQAFVLPGKGAEAAANLIGHASDNSENNKSTLFEFYRDANNEIKHQALKFNGTKLGERDADTTLSKSVDTGFLSFMKDCHHYFQFNNKGTRVGLLYYKDGTTFADVRIFGHSIKTVKKPIKRGNESVLFAVYYEVPFEQPELERFALINSLIEVDTKNNLHIHFTSFRRGQMHVHSNFKLSEFFGCYGRFSRKEQIKGVFYHKIFYLFINHFYITISDDLVESKFKIESKAYESGTDLQLGEDFKFEDYQSKWVKSLQSASYLSILDKTFNISVDSNGSLAFNPIEEPDLKRLMQNCSRQLLNVDEHLFCFEEQKYYLVGKMQTGRVMGKYSDIPTKYPITELFTGEIGYDSSETLEFIFNYKANKFVLFTQVHLFILDYSAVRVTDKKLVFPSKEIVKKEHVFYQNIDTNQDPVKVVTTTEKPKNDDHPRFDSTKLMILIVLAVIATVLLLVHLVYRKCTKKRPKKPNPPIKLENLESKVKLESRSGKSSINFSKLMNQSKTAKTISNKEASVSANYNKETTGKETTMNLSKFVNAPKKGEKSESSRILYIDSQTGLARKDQKSGLPAAELAAKDVANDAKIGSKIVNRSNTGEQRKSLPKGGSTISEGRKSLQKGSAPERESKIASDIESDGRLLTVGSSNFSGSETKEAEPANKKWSVQGRRGSIQSK